MHLLILFALIINDSTFFLKAVRTVSWRIISSIRISRSWEFNQAMSWLASVPPFKFFIANFYWCSWLFSAVKLLKTNIIFFYICKQYKSSRVSKLRSQLLSPLNISEHKNLLQHLLVRKIKGKLNSYFSKHSFYTSNRFLLSVELL